MDDIRSIRRTWWYRIALRGCRFSLLSLPVMLLGVIAWPFIVAGLLMVLVPWMWFALVRWYVIVEYDIAYGRFIDRDH